MADFAKSTAFKSYSQANMLISFGVVYTATRFFPFVLRGRIRSYTKRYRARERGTTIRMRAYTQHSNARAINGGCGFRSRNLAVVNFMLVPLWSEFSFQKLATFVILTTKAQQGLQK